MFPSDELLFGDKYDKYRTPERYKPREYLPRRLYRPFEIDASHDLTHHRMQARIYEKELELIERAKLRKASLEDLSTANKSQSLDMVSRIELDKRLEEVTDLLMEHFRQLSHSNMEKLSEMVSKSSQQRAERDRASNEIMREMQMSKYEQLERNIRDLQQRLRTRMDAVVEQVALTGRSFMEVKDEVHRLSETEGSLLRQLNTKHENRETCGNSEGGSLADIKISGIVESAPVGVSNGLQEWNERITLLEQEMKETLDRLNIHHNRLGMLTQRVDECKQNNLNTLLDFKQSMTFRIESHEKRERKEYNTVCNALNQLTGQLRQNEMHTEAVVERINCFETMLIEREGSLCLSQSLQNRRVFHDMQIGESMKGSNEIDGSILFKKDGYNEAELELSRPPNLSEFDDLNIQRGESIYKKQSPLEPEEGDELPEKPSDYNDDSLET